jgi:parallel beta-helix repeat protein
MRRNYKFILLITFFILLNVSTIYTSADEASQDINILQSSTQPSRISLQEMINQATSGSTLQIQAGIYSEIITIEKPLTLIGQGQANTFIHSTSLDNGYAIRITAKGVSLSGFDISNDGHGLYATAVKISASRTSIQNCYIHDTPVGVAIWSNDNDISNCRFQQCNDDAIVFLGTSTNVCLHNTIHSCSFIKNCDGIELQYASQNIISNCEFSDNTHAGIDAIASTNNDNTISHCTFSKNQGFGIYLAASMNNIMTDCDFNSDLLTLTHSTQNLLQNSHIIRVNLMDSSSLRIINCGPLPSMAITSFDSQYDIQNNHHFTKSMFTQRVIAYLKLKSQAITLLHNGLVKLQI